MTLGLSLNCGTAVGILENMGLGLVLKMEEHVIVHLSLKAK
jgi:hypothetical protein